MKIEPSQIRNKGVHKRELSAIIAGEQSQVDQFKRTKKRQEIIQKIFNLDQKSEKEASYGPVPMNRRSGDSRDTQKIKMYEEMFRKQAEMEQRKLKRKEQKLVKQIEVPTSPSETQNGKKQAKDGGANTVDDKAATSSKPEDSVIQPPQKKQKVEKQSQKAESVAAGTDMNQDTSMQAPDHTDQNSVSQTHQLKESPNTQGLQNTIESPKITAKKANAAGNQMGARTAGQTPQAEHKKTEGINDKMSGKQQAAN